MWLEHLGDLRGTDKLRHGYLPHYERLLGSVPRPASVLEIGVYQGASLRMWADFFWPDSTIVGVDIDPSCARLEFPDNVEVVISDALAYTPDRQFDVIVDDGSHQANDIMETWIRLWPYLKEGGWYVVEDLEVHYIPGWNKPEVKNPLGWMWDIVEQLARGTEEEINTIHQDKGGNTALSEFHLYEQIAFLRKGSLA